MKKIIALSICAALSIGVLSACGANSDTDEKSISDISQEAISDTVSDDDKLNIVTTIFPEYDWVKNLTLGVEDQVQVSMLLDSGVDLHSYQPTASDIMEISQCDMFIYVGGESDEWVEDALAESTNDEMVVINLLDVLGDSVKEEQVVDYFVNIFYIYLLCTIEVIKNAAIIVSDISQELQSIDSDNADVYQSNEDDYISKINELDTEYDNAVSEASIDTVLFGDRFPFRYLVDDYGLNYYAAFVGCSAETEASFETVTFLAGKVDELNLSAVMTIDGDDQQIAKTIIQNTIDKDQKILTMDSMQSTTTKDIENGATYLDIMSTNLDVLKEAIK